MSFNEEAWDAKVDAMLATLSPYECPDTKTCIPFMKEIFNAPESYHKSLRTRYEAGAKMGIVNHLNPDLVRLEFYDINELRAVWKAQGDQILEEFDPNGMSKAVCALHFYSTLVYGLRVWEELGIIPTQSGGSKKEGRSAHGNVVNIDRGYGGESSRSERPSFAGRQSQGRFGPESGPSQPSEGQSKGTRSPQPAPLAGGQTEPGQLGPRSGSSQSSQGRSKDTQSAKPAPFAGVKTEPGRFGPGFAPSQSPQDQSKGSRPGAAQCDSSHGSTREKK